MSFWNALARGLNSVVDAVTTFNIESFTDSKVIILKNLCDDIEKPAIFKVLGTSSSIRYDGSQIQLVELSSSLKLCWVDTYNGTPDIRRFRENGFFLHVKVFDTNEKLFLTETSNRTLKLQKMRDPEEVRNF